MVFGILLLSVISCIWFLMVAGWLWKITIGICGWIGIRYILGTYVSASLVTCLTISGLEVSWASTVATVVLIMSMAHTKAS